MQNKYFGRRQTVVDYAEENELKNITKMIRVQKQLQFIICSINVRVRSHVPQFSLEMACCLPIIILPTRIKHTSRGDAGGLTHNIKDQSCHNFNFHWIFCSVQDAVVLLKFRSYQLVEMGLQQWATKGFKVSGNLPSSWAGLKPKATEGLTFTRT